MDMREHNIRDLGVLAEVVAKEGYFKMARIYLREISDRIDGMEKLKGWQSSAEMVRELGPNKLLLELPIKETKETTLKHEPVVPVDESIVDEAKRRNVTTDQVTEERIDAVVEVANEVTEVPEPGLIRNGDGKVTHVSVQAGEPGYDPDIHENTALKIFCDGKHIENAHTADTVKGVVKYYKKNEQGRIKTLTLHGKVEIRGL